MYNKNVQEMSTVSTSHLGYITYEDTAALIVSTVASNLKGNWKYTINVSVTRKPELNRVLTSTRTLDGTQVNRFALRCHRYVTDLFAWAQPRWVFFKYQQRVTNRIDLLPCRRRYRDLISPLWSFNSFRLRFFKNRQQVVIMIWFLETRK